MRYKILGHIAACDPENLYLWRQAERKYIQLLDMLKRAGIHNHHDVPLPPLAGS